MDHLLNSLGMDYDFIKPFEKWPAKIEGMLLKECTACNPEGYKVSRRNFGSFLIEKDRGQIKDQISAALRPKKRTYMKCNCIMDNGIANTTFQEAIQHINFTRWLKKLPPVLIIRYDDKLHIPYSSVKLPLRLFFHNYKYILCSFIVKIDGNHASIVHKDHQWNFYDRENIFFVPNIHYFLDGKIKVVAAFYKEIFPTE